jgi:hypothetical protein
MGIPISKTVTFQDALFISSHQGEKSEQKKKKHKGTPAAHAPTIAITPALATVGRLSIWRRPHGILWLL